MCDTPGRAKRLGQEVDLIGKWNTCRINTMYYALKMKFDQNLDIQKN